MSLQEPSPNGVRETLFLHYTSKCNNQITTLVSIAILFLTLFQIPNTLKWQDNSRDLFLAIALPPIISLGVRALFRLNRWNKMATVAMHIDMIDKETAQQNLVAQYPNPLEIKVYATDLAKIDWACNKFITGNLNKTNMDEQQKIPLSIRLGMINWYYVVISIVLTIIMLAYSFWGAILAHPILIIIFSFYLSLVIAGFYIWDSRHPFFSFVSNIFRK